jgi:hypothetical protein
MKDQRTQAEKDAEIGGTIDAMFDGYVSGVLDPLHVKIGRPQTPGELAASRLDFLAGCKATLTLLSVARQKGVDVRALLGTLECEVFELLNQRPR